MTARTRRSMLGALGAAVLTGLGGCLGGSTSALGEEGSRLETGVRARASDLLDDRPVRCRGASVRATLDESDDPGYDDGFEFFPRYGTVKYVRHTGTDGEPLAFETTSFERWASMRCAKTALERVRTVTADRVGTDEFGAGITGSPRPFFNEGVVEVSHTTTTNSEGEVVGGSAVSFETLVEESPRHVRVSYRLDGKRFGRSVPVYANEATVQYQ